MNELLGWSALLFAGKWLLIGLVYFFLFVVLLAVRRELSGRVRPGRRVFGFSPGRLRVIQNGSDRALRPGQLLDLAADSRLGADANNEVVLRDQYISAHHARLRWDGAGWWIEDSAAPTVPW